ncbi:type I restriction enzyme M protein [Fontibacillus solani]|uniref:site-specific DNA-methyltransferase (adenine-specific) n=1 Tax=Fontibacillus solani TaxID=1572857 RepID=A0A7W3SS25_9BACL|nr:class I SAM-dependent DNA methyltransferase [Fontibacillus solani]MBA9085102.1 type I restriction enzyme M protein [Fontibacillus solani]
MNFTVRDKTKQLVDDLKAICANHGLGNDGNEYKIITEVFLYKFMNDKFFFEVRTLNAKYQSATNLEELLKALPDDEYDLLLLELPASVAQLNREHYISNLFNSQNVPEFAKLFDDTMRSVASLNADIFSVGTSGGEKVRLFSGISQYVVEEAKRDGFCRAIVNKLFHCNFGEIFHEKYDFFATIFEYLIKDYNKDGGGKYAEYYTPHAVARIMSEILVSDEVSNVKCYDPSAGTGSLLMSLAHQIGEDRCTIYSQDISQKSSTLLRMNLILNNLAHSLLNVVQGNTMTEPFHIIKREPKDGFDYIVSNPPFKLDFSDWRDRVDASHQTVQEGETEETKKLNARFFAGVPNIPNKDKDKMAIYLLFIQHIISSLNSKGKAAVVVPTGFLTEGKGRATSIANKIRMRLVDKGWLRAVVSMPSNIFATTGTNVSIIFIDKTNKSGKCVLVDASNLGTKIKDGKNQKMLLSIEEEQRIIDAVNGQAVVDDFSVVKSFADIKEAGYTFNPGAYFDVSIEYVNISAEEFSRRINESKTRLNELFNEGRKLEKDILGGLDGLFYVD